MGFYTDKGFTVENTVSLYRFKHRYTTTPKRSVEAPYNVLTCVPVRTQLGSTSFVRPSYCTAINFVQGNLGGPLMSMLVNTCYDRLKDAAYSSLQLGADIAEGHSTLRMVKDIGKGSANVGLKAVANSVSRITSSATRLLTAYRALRKFDLPAFYSALALKPTKKQRGRDIVKLRLAKQGKPITLSGRSEKFASSVWLTWWFGISPLLETIFSATQVLTGQLPGERFKASAKQQDIINNLDPGVTWQATGTGKTSVRMRCVITVDNPNAFLREQAGVNNPAAILWELIPFSFLVDWVLNISQCLNSMSDFSGCSLTKGLTVQFSSAEVRDLLGPPGPADYVDATYLAIGSNRVLGIMGPSLKLKLPKRLSVTRAATAMSLLVQALPKR